MEVYVEDKCLESGAILKGIYEIKEIIAKGELSIVYIAQNIKDKYKYVIKEYFPDKLVLRDLDGKTVLCKMPGLKDKYNNSRKEFSHEAMILKKFNNKNIAKYIDCFIENNTTYIVIQYYEGKTLDKYIEENKDIPIYYFFKNIFIPIINTIEFIHKKNILHRDIKPSNIIIDEKCNHVIIDFGSAINYKENKKKIIFITPGFSPLEFFSEESKQGTYSDIYSFAATIYYYLCGKAPAAVSERVIEDNIENINKYNKQISFIFSSIIMRNLSIDYGRRFSVLKLLKIFIYLECLILKIKINIRK
ncbi:serine/threonine-protein kinase [Clostridium sp. DJ247]|uniref:serine/threonine-protein kinase n=1 Tax=Clostridium sp. DJ247 TaxID=2726188 RepID=UPI0016295B94|nr:serine/threonine-protein kinase [Clostridium sp. DJ247]MBC2580529.1 serine/threonine protein kinase [Clostridium sp. DJ247]